MENNNPVNVSLEFDDVINIENFKIAWKQIKDKFSDDLVKCPCNHIDYEINLEDNLWDLIRRIKNNKYNPKSATIIKYAKSKGMNRPISILEIEDSIVLQAIIVKIAPLLDCQLGLLPHGVYSYRATGDDKTPFKGWYNEWPKYQKKICSFKRQGYDVLVVTDISSYYENIDHEILKEILLGNGIGKRIVDLLFFLLESWTHRPNYSKNIYRGIPQTTNQDPSGFLSNIFLYRHDKVIDSMKDCIYVRWVDDMNIAVKTKNEGKRILREITMTLRDLYLSPNTGKTKILDGEKIDTHFFFDENNYLDDFEKRERESRGWDNRSHIVKELERELKEHYEEFLDKEKLGGNWFKVLKRYYTLFKRIRSNYLIPNIIKHLDEYPTLDDKICDYLLAMKNQDRVFDVVVAYLRSQENLYESTEIKLLEVLLNLRVTLDKKGELLNFGEEVFFGKRNYNPLSWYSKAIAALIIAKYGEKSNIRKLAKTFYKSKEEEIKLRKHLIFVSILLGREDDDFKEVLKKARREYSQDIQTLVGLIDFIKSDSGNIPETIKRKLTLRCIRAPYINFLDIRIFILLKLLSFNINYHQQLKSVVKSEEFKKNPDEVMQEHLNHLDKDI